MTKQRIEQPLICSTVFTRHNIRMAMQSEIFANVCLNVGMCVYTVPNVFMNVLSSSVIYTLIYTIACLYSICSKARLCVLCSLRRSVLLYISIIVYKCMTMFNYPTTTYVGVCLWVRWKGCTHAVVLCTVDLFKPVTSILLTCQPQTDG